MMNLSNLSSWRKNELNDHFHIIRRYENKLLRYFILLTDLCGILNDGRIKTAPSDQLSS